MRYILCAWHKFHQHKLILLNKHVRRKLRLTLFHATAFPTAMTQFHVPACCEDYTPRLEQMPAFLLSACSTRKHPIMFGMMAMDNSFPSGNTRHSKPPTNSSKQGKHSTPSWMTFMSVSPQNASDQSMTSYPNS